MQLVQAAVHPEARVLVSILLAVVPQHPGRCGNTRIVCDERTGVANLPVLLDPRGAAARALGSRGLPTSIIVNRRGEEVARIEGDVAWDRADVLAALRRLAPPGPRA